MLKICTLPATRGISCSGIGDLYSQIEGANIADRASDASTVCSNGLSYIPKKGDRKAEEKKPWKLGVKTEKELQPVADMYKVSCAWAFSGALSC